LNATAAAGYQENLYARGARSGAPERWKDQRLLHGIARQAASVLSAGRKGTDRLGRLVAPRVAAPTDVMNECGLLDFGARAPVTPFEGYRRALTLVSPVGRKYVAGAGLTLRTEPR
jgi:hypothetical protein